MSTVSEYNAKLASDVDLKLSTQVYKSHVLPMLVNISPGVSIFVSVYTAAVNGFFWMSQTVTVISGEIMPLQSALNIWATPLGLNPV